jgi:signal transduction histidine kinase
VSVICVRTPREGQPLRKQMRFLYLKIFIWFWLAMVAVGITMGFVVSKTEDDPMSGPWRQEMSTLLPALAEKMAEVFEKQGPKGLKQYETGGTGPLRIQIHFLDEQGHDVATAEDSAKTEPSSETKELAVRASRSGKVEYLDARKTRSVAYRVSGPSGRQYVYERMISFTGSPPLFNARPSAQLIRVFAIVGVGGIVCLWLAWYISSPVRELRAATRALASGDLHARIAANVCRRSDELGDLGIDFNAMAERMQSLLESQRRLLRDISHELRSPLARLRVALDLAKEGAEPHSLRAHQRIEIEAERINEMIGDLLRLSRIETLTALPDKAEIDLAELVEEVVAETELEASRTGRTLNLSHAEPCVILGDRHLLRSVVENLIRNAMRYTPEGTAVEIDIRKQFQGGAWQALLSVRDHGPGVPDAHLADIFDAFYRVEYSRNRESGGTGLGLTIAQRAVHLHNGSIRAANLLPGGLEIEVLLPLSHIQEHPSDDLGISQEASIG